MSNDNIKVDEMKKTRKFNFWPMLMIFMLLGLAVGSVMSYEPIRNKIYTKEADIQNYIESDDFIYELKWLTQYIKSVKFEEKNEGDYNSSRRKLRDLKNVKYYVYDKEKQKTLTNIENYNEEDMIKNINNNRFYLNIDVNENNEAKIEVLSKEKDKYAIRQIFGLENGSDEKFSNMKLVYFVPQDIEYENDAFIIEVKEHSVINYVLLILIIGGICIFTITIIAFGIPYSMQNENPICRLYSKMFIEFKIAFWLMMIAIIVSFMEDVTIDYQVLDVIYGVNSYFYMIGIPIVFTIYFIIYVNIVYIKYIYYNGFKNGVIRNSIFGRMVLWVVNSTKDFILEVSNINSEKYSKGKFTNLIILNILALLFILSGGFFGFIVAVIYSIYVIKNASKISGKIKYLNNASTKLANGELDVEINEDIGILSPVAKNLNNIKEGFKVAVEKETKSERMRAELITNVSHDLKTPLTSIITYVDLLKKEDNTEEMEKEYIDILDKKSQRLKILIEDLFEASKANSGSIDLNLEKVDVVALFRQTVGEFEEKINSSSLDFKVNMPEEKIECSLDGRRTYRIFENLMNNILKYSMDNSRVYIDVKQTEKQVEFVFKNIASYEMNFDASEITERFTRGDKSRNIDGSGLGLAITKSLVKLQGGEFEIVVDGDLFKAVVIFDKI